MQSATCLTPPCRNGIGALTVDGDERGGEGG
eukprot:COSAG02_NODE_52016_length_310_cov_1.194313_1_plen_30_part_10